MRIAWEREETEKKKNGEIGEDELAEDKKREGQGAEERGDT